jgi:hypothetical protein
MTYHYNSEVGNYKIALVLASSLVIVFLILGCYSFSILSVVNAQQSGNLTKMIEDKYAKIYKSPVFVGPYGNNIPYQLVSVRYESSTTILISGNLIAPYVDTFNSGIWEAMDLLKGQYGFKLQQVMTNGVGSKANPTEVYILMTK